MIVMAATRSFDNMENILKEKERFMISLPELKEYMVQEKLDQEWLTQLEFNVLSEISKKANKNKLVSAVGIQMSSNAGTVEDEKGSFLIPGPLRRQPRSKRNTNCTLGDEGMSRPKRVTRSSKICEAVIDEENVVTVFKETRTSRRTKTLTKGSLYPENGSSSSPILISVNESSTVAESSTRKGKADSEKRSTRGSSRYKSLASGVRKSQGRKRMTKKKSSVLNVSAITRGKRNKASNDSISNPSFLEVPEIVQSRRVTRSKAAKDYSFVKDETETVRNKRVTRSKVQEVSTFVESESVVPVFKGLASPASNKNVQTQSPAILFSPYSSNSVKQRVEAFEGFTSAHVLGSNKGKQKESAASVSKQVSPILTSPAPKMSKIKVDPSPLKTMSRSVNKKVSPLAEGFLKESPGEVDKDSVIVMEQEKVEENKTCQVKGVAMEVDENEVVNDRELLKRQEDENEADDEWVSDDGQENEEKFAKKKKHKVISSTADSVKTSEPKIIETAVGSYKSLRNRKVKKTSEDLQLTLVQKPMEMEVKEAELKKKMQKEVEALKRKEEIMKKRTEAAKKKREEKMAKVKRTREELEKDNKDAKTKVRRLREGKKKPAAEPEGKREVEPERQREVEPEKILSPKVATPVPPPQRDLNITFDMKVKDIDMDSYNMTPCWQDKPPVQPDDPDEYGIADNSNCSSDEENDPRKTVPIWARVKQNDRALLTQALMPLRSVNCYWESKPSAPTILHFFGRQVSKRTLKRGLDYRTSSAHWNTPPARKLN